VIKTNGQGGVTSGAAGTYTSPSGTVYNGTYKGNTNVNSQSGYSSNKSVTVNGQTYSTSTQNRSTTIVTPQGSQTIVYPVRDR
jgi:hypothetical protein